MYGDKLRGNREKIVSKELWTKHSTRSQYYLCDVLPCVFSYIYATQSVRVLRNGYCAESSKHKLI